MGEGQREGNIVTSIVPSLADLLNRNRDTRYPIDDTKITTRCPRSDCFSFQCLAQATIASTPQEARYECSACGAALVRIHLDAEGEWAYTVAGAGIHIRLANSSRTRHR
jgi:ferredoxin-like protein FixX